MRALASGLFLAFSLSLSAQYPVWFSLDTPQSMDAEGRTQWTVTVTNRTAEPIHRLDFSIHASGGGIVTAPAEVCAIRFDDAACRTELAPGATLTFPIAVQFRGRPRHAFVTVASQALAAFTTEEAVFGREYVVTSTADAGPGTLRQAITDLNRECTDFATPCVVLFRIEGEEATIAPLSPLPAIVAQDLYIDGRGSARITLDGRAAGEANGLLFTRGTNTRVTDLTITGFRLNGIETHTLRPVVQRNRLVANGLRGISVFVGLGRVAYNELSDNGRSGGYFWTTNSVTAVRNVVTGNGASGLFFHKPVFSFASSEASENVIADNEHAGIGLSFSASGDFGHNSYRDNGAGPLDIGLDGPTTATIYGLPGQGAVVGAPVITSARFENGVTTITGRLAPQPAFGATFRRLSIFAGPENAQELVYQNGINRDDFTIQVPRDLRGQLVRAMMYTNVVVSHGDVGTTGTSELGEPRVVE